MGGSTLFIVIYLIIDTALNTDVRSALCGILHSRLFFKENHPFYVTHTRGTCLTPDATVDDNSRSVNTKVVPLRINIVAAQPPQTRPVFITPNVISLQYLELVQQFPISNLNDRTS